MLLRRTLLKPLAIAPAGAIGIPIMAWAQRPPVEKTLNLGQSCALNGPAAKLGIQYRNGLKAVFDAENDKGGVAGLKLNLVSLDDGYEPARTEQNTKKLLEDGTQLLIGPIGTPTTLAMSPLAKAAGVPIFAPFTGAESLRKQEQQHIWHFRASYNAETREIVRHAQSLKSESNICLIVQDDGFGTAGLDGVKLAAPEFGAKVGLVVKVPRNTTDKALIQTRVAEIMRAKPSAVVLVSTYGVIAEALKAFRSASYVGNCYTVSFVGTDALSTELGSARGATRGIIISQVVPKPAKQARKVATTFALLAEQWGLAPTHTAFEGYLAGLVLIESIRRLNGKFSADRWQSVMGSLELNLGDFPVDFRTKPGAAIPNRVGSTFVEMSMLSAFGQVLS